MDCSNTCGGGLMQKMGPENSDPHEGEPWKFKISYLFQVKLELT